MTAGQSLTIDTIRVATALYVFSLAAWIGRRDSVARAAWTAGCVLYIAHVAAAFQFYHHWSHTAAYLATAKQAGWGGGLYFNYLFTAVWIADAGWWWLGRAAYRQRPSWITIAVHGFLGFMFFNATVVFASGFVRWFGIAATLALAAFWWKMKKRDSNGGALQSFD
jgi:hypothetical protein